MYCRNLLLNSSFEEDLEFWNYTTLPIIETDCVFHGNKCASITCKDTPSWNYFASIPFKIVQGHKYYFGGFARGTAALQAKNVKGLVHNTVSTPYVFKYVTLK